MKSTLVRALSLLALAAVITSPLFAQASARFFGQVTDSDGNPVVGAELTVQYLDSDQITGTATTDNKGKYKLQLIDATRTYELKITAEGYNPYMEAVKIPIRANERKNFVLITPEQATIQAAGSDPIASATLAFNEGAHMANAGDNEGALAKFEEALELNPDLGPAHVGRAIVLLAQGDAESAAAAAERALEIDANDERAMKVRLDAYTSLGDEAKAAEAQTELMAADPAAAVGVYYNEAAELYNNGDLAAAQPLLEKVIELRPTHAKAHYMLGLCMVNNGDMEQAKAYLTKFVEMAPNDPDAAIAQEMIGAL